MFLTGGWHLHVDLDMVTDLLIKPWSKFWLSILILEVQRTLSLSPDLELWRCWRFLTLVLHLDLDLDMVIGLW